jgi:hypothetical protein
MGYRIQKLGIGGVLDQAVSLLRDNIGLLFQIMAYLYIPIQLCLTLYVTSVMPVLAPGATSEDIVRYQQAAGSIGLLVLPVSLLTVFVVLPVTNAAVIYAISERYLGKSVSAIQSLKFGLSRILPLLWTAILMGLAIMGGLILFIVPGILCMIWFALAQQVTVLESINGGAALGRSRKLVSSSMGTVIVLGIVGLSVGFSLGLIPQLLGQNYISAVISVLVNAVATLFGSATMTVYYFSCRCNVDNFDLEQLALAVEGSAAAN